MPSSTLFGLQSSYFIFEAFLSLSLGCSHSLYLLLVLSLEFFQTSQFPIAQSPVKVILYVQMALWFLFPGWTLTDSAG